MKGRTAARRYAKALMELAKRDEAITEMGEQLERHRLLFASTANLYQVLNNPTIDITVKNNILSAILERTQPPALLRNFLSLLLKQDRFRQFEFICQHFVRMANDELRRVVAQVTSAVELGAAQRQAVTQKIADMTQKSVILETQVDPSILGGIVVRVNNVVLDGSLRGQLVRLRKELIGG